MATPPPFPQNSVYTKCWCEENIYFLAQHLATTLSLQDWSIHVVFISNHAKTANARELGLPVVWDYHVILVVHTLLSDATVEPLAWIYDFDSAAPTPMSKAEYLATTFRTDIPIEYHRLVKFPIWGRLVTQTHFSLFRIIPAAMYLKHLSQIDHTWRVLLCQIHDDIEMNRS
ncbi:hypothetical protein BDZ89DRAFT_940438 [Hymenopellis radicata]|nr:hypothetical protein BDZ89DRAFT_940438 [Hymenopellis radicata]